ncbi:MAG: hypothetical protein KIT84_24625 [Labilithrix sp.]|nr:hypothetical protein [Labilithrix sp.]MCW5814235.1 hypothetical protein [Labilithrix sp.]
MSGDRIPAPKASRPAVGVRARTAATPLSAADIDSARLVVLSEADASSLESAVAALPDPDELDPGSLVVIPAQVEEPKSLARSVLAVFGRAKTVARTRRCTALVARGYVEVGAAVSDDGDLAWGRAPSTEPC